VTDIVKLGIARTFQNIELIPDLSIIDNVIVGAHKFFKTSVFEHIIKSPRMIKQEKELYAKALSILEFLNIDKIKDAYVMGLPYGILKKVELARALITDPSLLILDEPAAGLNDLETEELSNIVLKLKKERHMTVLLIEHDMRFVMNMSDHVCAISFGKFLAYDKPNQIKNNLDVQEAYLGKDE
jgi:branched-chain amino acid transport system ATP-binding protein